MDNNRNLFPTLEMHHYNIGTDKTEIINVLATEDLLEVSFSAMKCEKLDQSLDLWLGTNYTLCLSAINECAAFSIYKGSQQISSNAVAWSLSGSKIWNEIETSYLLELRDKGLVLSKPTPRMPEFLPWLATIEFGSEDLEEADYKRVATFSRTLAQSLSQLNRI
jgi:hypothetical protein